MWFNLGTALIAIVAGSAAYWNGFADQPGVVSNLVVASSILILSLISAALGRRTPTPETRKWLSLLAALLSGFFVVIPAASGAQANLTFGRDNLVFGDIMLFLSFAAFVTAPGTQFLRWAWSWLTTVDHKRIAKLYLASAAFFFVIGGIEAFMIRLQLYSPHNKLFVGNTFNQLLTMHGTTMIFFAVMPLFAGYINAVVPLQIGARDVAFPFLNGLSFWLFLAGGLILNSSWFLGGAPDDGWFAYAPLSTNLFNPGPGMDFYDLGLQVAGIGSFLTGINFIVTIVNMRAPGMTLRRMPMFVWASLVTAVLLLFALPPLTIDLFLLMFDRVLGTNFFEVKNGGNVVIWQHLFWTFGHPEVYILVLPAFGIISEVIPTFARKPLFGYDSMVLAIAAIGFLAFMVWSHHMFTVGMGPVVNSIFALTSMAIAVPTGIKIFNWIATMWGGSIRFTTAMLYAIGFIPIFVIGGMSGVMLAMAPADFQYNSSYFLVAHFHYVMIGGSLFALLAASFYWFPRIYGKMLDERLGKISFWFVFIGFNITFFPQHLLGLWGMPRRVYTYRADLGLTTANELSTIGVVILAIGFIFFFVNVIKTFVAGEKAVMDPWDGRTLEWTLPVPTPEYNFAKLPLVSSLDAWWAEKQAGHQAMPAAEEPTEIHMPSPSRWPIILSIGLFVAAYGIIFRFGYGAFVGLAVAAFAIYHTIFDEDHGYHVKPGEGDAV